MTEPTEELPVLIENLQRAQRLAWAIFGAMLLGTAGVAVAVAAGVELDGPAVAVAVFFGVGFLGSLYLLSVNGRVISHPLVVALLSEPRTITNVSLKRQRTDINGLEASSYLYLVVTLQGGQSIDVWLRGEDVEDVVQEIRACAPKVGVDPEIRDHHYRLRVR